MWELQESEERFRGLIDALGDLVVHRDRDGRIVYANKVFAELDRRRPARPRRPHAGRARHRCRRRSRRRLRRRRMPELHRRRDPARRSGPRWFSWIELSVRDKASDAVSHRAIARDITARKRAETALINARERAEFASQAKSRFLATVSHEIRTPMNGIMGMAKLLADTRLSPRAAHLCRRHLDLGERAAGADRGSARLFQDRGRPLRARAAAGLDARDRRQHRRTAGGARLRQGHRHRLPCRARRAADRSSADPGRLRQVLLNLIGNAIKFTDSGGVLVERRRMPATEASDRIRFTVTDTGPGMRRGRLGRIFEEFEQADGTSTRAAWRRRPRPCHLQAHRHVDGRHDRRRERARRGLEIPFRDPGNIGQAGGRRAAAALAGRRVVILSKNAVEADAIARTISAYGGSADIAATVAAGGVRTPTAATRCLSTPRWRTAKGRLLKRLRESRLRRAPRRSR